MLVTAAERAKACVLSHHSLESSDCAHSSCDIYMYTDTYIESSDCAHSSCESMCTYIYIYICSCCGPTYCGPTYYGSTILRLNVLYLREQVSRRLGHEIEQRAPQHLRGPLTPRRLC
jgi:hypothetical protein